MLPWDCYILMWSNSAYLYIHIAGKSRPSHRKIETQMDGSTFFVV